MTGRLTATPEHAGESVEHVIDVAAPAEDVYRLLADAGNWAWIFGPFVHLDVAEGGTAGAEERVTVWSHGDGEVHRWVKHRVLHPDRLRIDYRPEQLPPTLAAMERSFVVEPVGERAARVRLVHRFRAAGSSAPDGIRDTIDRISDAELAGVKAAAEPLAERPDLLLVFGETVHLPGRPADVYDFLWDAGAWPDRIPHVSEVQVQDTGDAQLVAMRTAEARGGTLTTKTVRIGFPHRAIVFKQLLLPPVGRAHVVRWSLAEESGRTAVTSRHTVLVDAEGARRMLGADTDPGKAAEFVRRELTTKTRLIFDAAGEHLGRAS